MALISAPSFSQQKQTVAVTLDAKVFKAKIESSKNAQVLDVRTPKEWESGIIEGATKINFYESNFSTEVQKLDKSAPVFVYCAAGGRSASAMKQMKQLGFTQIYNLQGGIGAWKSAGYEVH